MKTLPEWVYSVFIYYVFCALLWPFMSFYTSNAYEMQYWPHPIVKYALAFLLFSFSALMVYAMLTFEKKYKEDAINQQARLKLEDDLFHDLGMQHDNLPKMQRRLSSAYEELLTENNVLRKQAKDAENLASFWQNEAMQMSPPADPNQKALL